MSISNCPILFISFFMIISDGPISVLSSSKIILDISFGFIVAYKSPFSLTALYILSFLFLILLAFSINLFLISLFFFANSDLFLLTKSIFSLFALKALFFFNKKFLA